MAIAKMAQLRFYSQTKKGANLNTPYNNPKSYCEPTCFAKYAPIKQLGIQALPGTRFYINNSTEPIIIGASGIYELDLRDTNAIISALHFSYASMERIEKSENGHLIIDLVYTTEGD